jgi:hypothetical protein
MGVAVEPDLISLDLAEEVDPVNLGLAVEPEWVRLRSGPKLLGLAMQLDLKLFCVVLRA